MTKRLPPPGSKTLQLEAVEAAYTEAAALYREADDRWGLAIAVLGLAEVALACDACDQARAYAQEALARFEQVGAQRRAEEARRLLARIAEAAPNYAPNQAHGAAGPAVPAPHQMIQGRLPARATKEIAR